MFSNISGFLNVCICMCENACVCVFVVSALCHVTRHPVMSGVDRDDHVTHAVSPATTVPMPAPSVTTIPDQPSLAQARPARTPSLNHSLQHSWGSLLCVCLCSSAPLSLSTPTPSPLSLWVFSELRGLGLHQPLVALLVCSVDRALACRQLSVSPPGFTSSLPFFFSPLPSFFGVMFLLLQASLGLSVHTNALAQTYTHIDTLTQHSHKCTHTVNPAGCCGACDS